LIDKFLFFRATWPVFKETSRNVGVGLTGKRLAKPMFKLERTLLLACVAAVVEKLPAETLDGL
jgi:hypothetical protein